LTVLAQQELYLTDNYALNAQKIVMFVLGQIKILARPIFMKLKSNS